jgi:hypothetical protein
MEKISWTDRVREEEVLQSVKEERNISQRIKRRKVNLSKNCPLKHVIEGKTEVRIEVKGRRRKRRKQLLDDLMETRGYWKLKGETPDRTLWRIRFGKVYVGLS